MPSFIAATDFGLFLLITILIFVPIAAIAFARSGRALRELGRGPWAIDRDPGGEQQRKSTGAPNSGPDGERAVEIRQMVVAADYRRRIRGESGIEIEEEVARLLAVETAPPGRSAEGVRDGDAQLVIEIRQLVVANNERRVRRGLEPLDVDVEVARRLEEWSD